MVKKINIASYRVLQTLLALFNNNLTMAELVSELNQKGFGTYSNPYSNPRHNTSLLMEAEYFFPKKSQFCSWSIKGAYSIDKGKLHGNNHGFQFTISKSGLLNL